GLGDAGCAAEVHQRGFWCGRAGAGQGPGSLAEGMSPADRRRRRGRTMLMVALLALLGAVLASFAVGPLRLPPLEVMQALAVKLGLLDP
ncbi:hypothetical protein, partial [Klebsiella aerogenes]|uniref:hypothetical protein n=1 Tax=Klebsiella aerogenes TaxID=548 RepID=UPI001954A252